MTSLALAREVETRDREVRRSIADLHFLVNCPSEHPSWIARLRREIDAFSEHLTCHFALQESDGYLEHVETQAPQLHDQVDRLHREQHELIRELITLQDAFAVAASTVLPILCRRLDALLTRLREHETCKTDLLSEAFNAEPAAMD